MRLLLLLLLFFVCASTNGQTQLGDWTFHPNYTLNRNAANYPGNKIEMPESRFQRFKMMGDPILFYGQKPTERRSDFLEPEQFPTEAFSVEMWLLNHVNLPIGVLFSLKGKNASDEPALLLGYYDTEAVFHIQTDLPAKQDLVAPVNRGWKKYWNHLVGTYDGQAMKLYLNGDLVVSKNISGLLKYPNDPLIEVAGYFAHEPYMEISNLLKSNRLYDYALNEEQINDRFDSLKTTVEKGTLFPNVFHFNAGPYLHYATPNSINLLWETNQIATAEVAYGTSIPLENKRKLDEAQLIHEITLNDLSPETPYYYEVTATTLSGDEMKSGVLTFGTAPVKKTAISFCIIGDTESRPHINHRLGEMIWEEKPNFIMHLGDVTDGGKELHKFEWNYEYFTGIVPVASRIPVFPVPGNGESDLYWYNRYHKLPAPESYYAFKYGDAEFFMLNSNANLELKKGGEQYEWLKEKLAQSDAKWKFVAHHHCPVSSDENDFGNTWQGKTSTKGDPKFDDLKKLYESSGVDIVFFGHVHSYERTYPLIDGQIDEKNGVIYIMSGGAGGHLEDFAPTRYNYSNKIQRGNHYCRVDIFDKTFTFKMYDLEGRMKDMFELRKE